MLLLLLLYARWVLADRCLRYLADTSQLSQQNVMTMRREEGRERGGSKRREGKGGGGVVSIVAAGVV